MDAGAERVGLDLWTYRHDYRTWFIRITDYSDHGVPTDDPQIGGDVVVSSHALPVVGEVTGTHPKGGASAAMDALAKAGDAGFRARIVAFGRFLAPEGTDVARIAAVATALALPRRPQKKVVVRPRYSARRRRFSCAGPHPRGDVGLDRC